MFGLSTYITLFFAVALLLAVVVALPRIRMHFARTRQDDTLVVVPPLNSVRKMPEPDSGGRTRH